MSAPRFKLLWDYRGADGPGTAAHFHTHLREFLARSGLEGESGVEAPGPHHGVAWFIAPIHVAEQVLKALRPHRAERLDP